MKEFPSRRDKIILAAIDIMDELGLQGLSTKEIARRHGMSESLLYRYFSGKDDVIVAVVEYYSRYDSSIINSIVKKDLSSKEKIIDFVKSYVEYYENYPAITSLVNSYESLKGDSTTRKMIEDISDTRINALMKLAAEAQEDKSIGSTLTAYDISVILWGYITKATLIWRIKNYSFSLKDSVLATTEKMLKRF